MAIGLPRETAFRTKRTRVGSRRTARKPPLDLRGGFRGARIFSSASGVTMSPSICLFRIPDMGGAGYTRCGTSWRRSGGGTRPRLGPRLRKSIWPRMPPRHKSPSNVLLSLPFAASRHGPAVRAGPARVAAFFRTSAALRKAPHGARGGFRQCRKSGANHLCDFQSFQRGLEKPHPPPIYTRSLTSLGVKRICLLQMTLLK
jgi:hypothetical protein